MSPTPPRSVVITGASTGIGRASALRLDREGFRVFAGVRRTEDGESLAEEASERLTPLLVDVTDAASVDAAAKDVAAALGDAGLGGLFCNAGIPAGGPLEFVEPGELRQAFEVNVFGVVTTGQAFLPLLRRAHGRILITGSMGGYLSNPMMGPYAATKFAVEAIADAWRRELRPWGLEVVLLEPGSIETKIWEKANERSDDLRDKLSGPGQALYGDMAERFQRFLNETAGRAIPAEKVADAVLHALTAPTPKTRYRIGVDAQVARAVTHFVPDRAIDALTARLLGFPGKGQA
jgi:NAD(P)-dependent dehydrogenase (short-subunit alcohol dehydrogenase family)